MRSLLQRLFNGDLSFTIILLEEQTLLNDLSIFVRLMAFGTIN